MEFEWDPAKARTTISRRGVRFEDARHVFLDLNAIEMIDETSQEERWRLLGRKGDDITNGRLYRARRQGADYFRQKGEQT